MLDFFESLVGGVEKLMHGSKRAANASSVSLTMIHRKFVQVWLGELIGFGKQAIINSSTLIPSLYHSHYTASIDTLVIRIISRAIVVPNAHWLCSLLGITSLYKHSLRHLI